MRNDGRRSREYWLCDWSQCRNLVADESELVLRKLLALKDTLEVQKSPQALLDSGIDGVCSKFGASSGHQGFDVAIKSGEIDFLGYYWELRSWGESCRKMVDLSMSSVTRAHKNTL